MHAQDSSDPTGIKDMTPRGDGDVARARERKALAALQLRRSGATWEEVAEVIGFPTGRAALVACERALEKELKSEESSHFMRQMAGDRLERLLRSVWYKAINPKDPEHLVAVDRARLLVDRHAKLFGLDAPTEMVVHNPAQAQLEQWVATVTAIQTPQLEEGDIFDAEVVEDDLHTVKEDPDAVPPE